MTTQINGTGNLTIEDSRIKGDFSNATIANRVMFQTSTVNGTTAVEAIPNGTGTISAFNVANSSDPNNASIGQLTTANTDIRIQSGIRGTGTYLPMTFYTGGAERMRIDTSGNVLVTNPAGLGYGTGSGGTVTQATSKSTAVTLNKPTGQITMHNAALAANTTVQFVFNNSLFSATDLLLLTMQRTGLASSTNYLLWCDASSGAPAINLRNISAGSLSEAVVINFAIIKGAAA